MTPRFNPEKAIVFDLARGSLRDDEGTPRINVPVHALLRLCDHAGQEAQKDFAQSLGNELGRRVAERLGQAASGARADVWADHLGGQLALLGLGDLRIEQWGRALVLAVQNAPSGCSALIGQLLGAALQRALGRDMQLVSFDQGSSTSYLVVSQSTAQRVTGLIATGAGLGQVIDQLHREAS